MRSALGRGCVKTPFLRIALEFPSKETLICNCIEVVRLALIVKIDAKLHDSVAATDPVR